MEKDDRREREEAYDEYLSKIKSRLQAGHDEYGNGSFSHPVDKTLLELQEEILDIAGWGFIAYTQIESMRHKFWPVRDLQGEADHDDRCMEIATAETQPAISLDDVPDSVKEEYQTTVVYVRCEDCGVETVARLPVGATLEDYAWTCTCGSKATTWTD